LSSVSLKIDFVKQKLTIAYSLINREGVNPLRL